MKTKQIQIEDLKTELIFFKQCNSELIESNGSLLDKNSRQQATITQLSRMGREDQKKYDHAVHCWNDVLGQNGELEKKLKTANWQTNHNADLLNNAISRNVDRTHEIELAEFTITNLNVSLDDMRKQRDKALNVVRITEIQREQFKQGWKVCEGVRDEARAACRIADNKAQDFAIQIEKLKHDVIVGRENNKGMQNFHNRLKARGVTIRVENRDD